MQNEKVTVFLGGTCAGSTWRDELIPMLDERVEAFNPVVADWTPECQAIEDDHRENDDVCLYVITPEGEGFYSFVEVVDDSNKRPDRTVLCILTERDGKEFSKHNLKCAKKTAELVLANGATVTDSLEKVALILNGFQKKEQVQIKVITK